MSALQKHHKEHKKGKPQTRGKYSQHGYLTAHLYPEYTVNLVIDQ